MFDTAAFFNTSPLRANCLEWLPIEPGQSVLTHDSVSEAVLTMLKNKGARVEALSDSQLERMGRNPARGNMDYIILMGVKTDVSMLSNFYKKLKNTGRLILGMHNRFGASYLAGQPAHQDDYFGALESPVCEKSDFCSLKKLRQMLHDAGIPSFSEYYPYPDMVFTTNIYSDRYWPKSGDFHLSTRNFIYDKLELFSPNRLWEQALYEGIYPETANDFLIVTGRRLPQVMIRYSNDREKAYRIKTEIMDTELGFFVRKSACAPEAVAHLHQMAENRKRLCTQYDEEAFHFIECETFEEGISFPFVKGTPLSELFIKKLQSQNREELFGLFDEFLGRLCQGRAAGFTNYDFIFSNILIDGDVWNVIDYEWAKERDTAPDELAFRAAYCFSLEYQEFPLEEIGERLGFSEKKQAYLIEQETVFQREITGEEKALDSLLSQYGGDTVNRETVLRALILNPGDSGVQIYEDYGEGFSEEQSYGLPQCFTEYGQMTVSTVIPEGIRRLRIDPLTEPCIVQIKRVYIEEQEIYAEKGIQINGIKGKAAKNSYPEYIFATDDPNIVLDWGKLSEGREALLTLEMEVHSISLHLANTLAKSVKRII